MVDNTCKGKCSGCAECCGPFIPITYHEVKKIKKVIKEYNLTYNPHDYITSRGIEIQCPFLNPQTRKCKLHEISVIHKPEVCKVFKCCLSEDTIHKNKLYFDSRADINGATGTFKGLDLIFFDNPFMTLMYSVYHLKQNTPDKLDRFLRDTGNSDVADAIKRGDIQLEWSDDKHGC